MRKYGGTYRGRNCHEEAWVHDFLHYLDLLRDGCYQWEERTGSKQNTPGFVITSRQVRQSWYSHAETSPRRNQQACCMCQPSMPINIRGTKHWVLLAKGSVKRARGQLQNVYYSFSSLASLMYKQFKRFTGFSLFFHANHPVKGLCASGWTHYTSLTSRLIFSLKISHLQLKPLFDMLLGSISRLGILFWHRARLTRSLISSE